MEFGEKLRQARNQAGLTQEAVAQKLGVTRQSVSNWEHNRSYPDLGSATLLSELYGLSLDILLKGDDAREQLRKRQETLRRIYSWCVDGALLLMVLAVTLVRLDKFSGGLFVGFWALGLHLVPHILAVWKLGADKTSMALRVLAVTLWFAGAMTRMGGGSLGTGLVFAGLSLNVYVDARMEQGKPYFRHSTVFTGFVVAVILVLFFVPMAERSLEAGDFNVASPFDGSRYRVEEVLVGEDAPLPMLSFWSTNKVRADYPGQSPVTLGEDDFVYVPQGEGSDYLGIWELVPEGSRVRYRAAVDRAENLTLEYWEGDTLQWRYLLGHAPAMGVTIVDVLGVITSAISWSPTGAADPEEVNTIPLRGKGTIKLSVNNGLDTVTLYQDGVEQILTKNDKGLAEIYLDAQGERRTVRFQIPHDGGEFLMNINMTP